MTTEIHCPGCDGYDSDSTDKHCAGIAEEDLAGHDSTPAIDVGVTVQSALQVLQAAVAKSLNEQQAQTGMMARAMFLSTEVGEVQRELLKLTGHYGAEESRHAKANIAKELCDVIWNACELANQLGIELDGSMDALLRYNPGRKHW